MRFVAGSVALACLMAAAAAQATLPSSYSLVEDWGFDGKQLLPADAVPTAAPVIFQPPTVGGTSLTIGGTNSIAVLMFTYNGSINAFCLSNFPANCANPPAKQISSQRFLWAQSIAGDFVVVASQVTAITVNMATGAVTNVTSRSGPGQPYGNPFPLVKSSRFNLVIVPVGAFNNQVYKIFQIDFRTGTLNTTIQISAPHAVSGASSAPIASLNGGSSLFALQDNMVSEWSLGSFQKINSVPLSCLTGDIFQGAPGSAIGIQLRNGGPNDPTYIAYWGNTSASGMVFGAISNYRNLTSSNNICYKGSTEVVMHSVGLTGDANFFILNLRNIGNLSNSQVLFLNTSSGAVAWRYTRDWVDRYNVPTPFPIGQPQQILLNVHQNNLAILTVTGHGTPQSVAQINNVECQGTPFFFAEAAACLGVRSLVGVDGKLNVRFNYTHPLMSLFPWVMATDNTRGNVWSATYIYIDNLGALHSITLGAGEAQVTVDETHPGVVALVVILCIALLSVGAYLLFRHRRAQRVTGDYAEVQ